ncbi:MAG: hypothetical protein R3B44_04315 [Candidatus Brocadiaceae bacterium]
MYHVRVIGKGNKRRDSHAENAVKSKGKIKGKSLTTGNEANDAIA